MGRERAEGFADRLPPVVPRDEADIDHLPDEMADLLYPGRRPRPFRMAVQFPEFEGPELARAVELARRSPVYRMVERHGGVEHHAAFAVDGADTLRDLFALVGGRPGTEVFVDGKAVPYARELWLPLFWIFVGTGAGAGERP